MKSTVFGIVGLVVFSAFGCSAPSDASSRGDEAQACSDTDEACVTNAFIADARDRAARIHLADADAERTAATLENGDDDKEAGDLTESARVGGAHLHVLGGAPLDTFETLVKVLEDLGKGIEDTGAMRVRYADHYADTVGEYARKVGHDVPLGTEPDYLVAAGAWRGLIGKLDRDVKGIVGGGIALTKGRNEQVARILIEARDGVNAGIVGAGLSEPLGPDAFAQLVERIRTGKANGDLAAWVAARPELRALVDRYGRVAAAVNLAERTDVEGQALRELVLATATSARK